MKRSIDGTQAAPARLPTLPALAGLGADRSALVAALLFVEGAASKWGEPELVGWMRDHLVTPGYLAAPTTVTETLVGTIVLPSAQGSVPPPMSQRRASPSPSPSPSSRPPSARRPSGGSPRVAHLDELPKLLGIARSRVVVTMRAFRGPPSDDRFLQAAIFGDRVARSREPGARQNTWLPRLDASMELATMVLTLFAADILMHREAYDAGLSVCDVCGRIAFVHESAPRNRCAEHPSSNDGRSGFFKRA